ncbi:hypothetical protein [Hymenobacter sp. B81]|uniref:hypothetical protein n=1 Tax=Hymenobacter sp. B81 TaxID=3344878 RepID=UPI0037DC75DA
MLRLSLGLEHIDDIKADLQRAFDAVANAADRTPATATELLPEPQVSHPAPLEV